jgi:hypothetical protein
MRVVPRLEVCFLPEKSFISERDRSQDMFKKVSKSVFASTVLVSPDPLSPTPSPSSAMKTPENAEEDPDDPEPADEGDFQMEYSSD